VTLGALIDTLRGLPPDARITLDDGDLPGEFDSYRGYYEDLAIEPTPAQGTYVSVADLLARAREVNGATLQGYKGGDFLMDRHTRLWVAHYGECSSRAVLTIASSGDGFVIRTGDIGDYA
jgi:hypothetical protein